MFISIFHILFASVCIAGIAYELYAMHFAQRCKQWPTTSGTILNAQIETRQDSDPDFDYHDTHEPRVHYAYRVDGELYESRRLFFGSQMTNDYFEASDSLFGIHKNKKVTVYYDPSKPQRSVLQIGAGHVKPWIIIAYIAIYTAFLCFN